MWVENIKQIHFSDKYLIRRTLITHTTYIYTKNLRRVCVCFLFYCSISERFFSFSDKFYANTIRMSINIWQVAANTLTPIIILLFLYLTMGFRQSSEKYASIILRPLFQRCTYFQLNFEFMQRMGVEFSLISN